MHYMKCITAVGVACCHPECRRRYRVCRRRAGSLLVVIVGQGTRVVTPSVRSAEELQLVGLIQGRQFLLFPRCSLDGV